jgi:DNA-binding beta-propeller fold protein YncE
MLLAASPLLASDPAGQWQLEKLETLSGFARPESVTVDPSSGHLIVSNQNGPFWQKDGQGYLTRLLPDGKVEQLRWIPAEGTDAFHKPAGTAWCRDLLWVADVDCLRLCDPRTREVRTIQPPGAKWLNDVATDGSRIFVSDSAANVIFVVHPDDTFTTVKSPPGPNGLTWFKGQLYGVSYQTHEIYTFDAEGREEPKPFGLAKHFKFLDGIAILDDGTVLVSDYAAGQISAVSPDRFTVYPLATLVEPADFIVDPKNQLLYVPQIAPSLVQVFRLVQGPGGSTPASQREE